MDFVGTDHQIVACGEACQGFQFAIVPTATYRGCGVTKQEKPGIRRHGGLQRLPVPNPAAPVQGHPGGVRPEWCGAVRKGG